MTAKAYRFDDPRAADAVKSAREVVADAVNKVGDEAIADIVLPTIERVLQGGVTLVDLVGIEGKGIVRVLRTSGLGSRLKKVGLPMALRDVAVRFNRDFEKARIGGLTANYGGGSGGKRTCEPERWCEAIHLLKLASACLDRDERVSVYGYVLFDISSADIGAHILGGLTTDQVAAKHVNKYLLHKALNKLEQFYECWDADALLGLNEG